MIKLQRLTQLRKEKKISQKALATLMKVSQSTISKWETGKMDMYCNQLIKLYNIFNVRLDYIIGLSDEREIIKRTN